MSITERPGISKSNWICRLSDELLIDIFLHIVSQPNGYRSLARCSKACRSFHRLSQDNVVARAVFMSINQRLGRDSLNRWPALSDLPPSLTWAELVKDQLSFMSTWLSAKPANTKTDSLLKSTPFDTTLVDLVYPKHLISSDPRDQQQSYKLKSIDRVHIHFPAHKPNCAVIGVSAFWTPEGDGLTDSRGGSSNGSQLIHLLDGFSLAPVSTFENGRGNRMCEEFLAVDAVHKRVVTMMPNAVTEDDGSEQLLFMLRLLTFSGDVLQANLFPGFAPADHQIILHIHDDNTYKLIFKHNRDTDLLVIWHLHATDFSRCRDDIKIRAFDRVHYYDPLFPSILITGDGYGSVRVWCTETGQQKCSFQVAHGAPMQFLSLRPWIRPGIVSDSEPSVWTHEKWLQLFTITRPHGTWEAMSHSALHSIVGASNQVPATIALDHQLYQDFDEELNLRAFGKEKKGLTWFLDPECNRPQCDPCDQPAGCLYREWEFFSSCLSIMLAHQFIFTLDSAGDLSILDMARTEDFWVISGAAGWTAQGAHQALQAQVDASNDWVLNKHCFPEGHVGTKSLTLPRSTLAPFSSSRNNNGRMGTTGDTMFLGRDWQRILAYQGKSLVVFSRSK